MGRRCNSYSGIIYGSYERVDRINFREDSFVWDLKVLVRFLRVKRNRRATNPPPHVPFSTNVTNKKFEKAILVKIVQQSDNKTCGVDTTLQDQGVGIVSYVLGIYMVIIERILV